MKKKCMVICSVILAFAMTACGAAPAASTPTSGAQVISGASTIPEKPEKLTLVSVANATGLWDYVKEWEEKTGIRVEISEMDLGALQTQATTYFAAQSPDIDLVYTYVALTAEWGSAGYLEEISSYLTEEEWSQFSQGALNCVRYKEGVYGLPYFYSIRLFYNNMDLLREKGFEEPPKNWDEFMKIAKACTDPSKDQYGVLMGLGNNEAVMIAYQDICALYDQTIISADNELLFTNEKGVAALEDFVELQTSGVLDPASYGVSSGPDRRARFLTGNVAMAWEWAPLMAEIKAEGTFEGAISLTPEIEVSGALTGSEGLAVSKFSNNKYWAMDLLKYLTSDDVQTRYAKTSGWFPVKTKVFEDEEILKVSASMQAAKAQAEHPTFRWAAPYYSEAMPTLADNILQALNEKVPAQQALETAAEKIEPIIRSYQ